jgi:hypothetical protein
MLEKNVEDYLRSEVERHGGVCLKLNPKGYKGIPDRLVILPGGWVCFVELKRPKGGVVSALQVWWLRRLWSLKINARVASTKAQVDELLARAEGVDQDNEARG